MLNIENGKGPKAYLTRLLGMRTTNNQYKVNPSNDEVSRFTFKRYSHILGASFVIGSQCCDVMKKAPVHKYCKETGRVSITAQMASESNLRKNIWIRYGCNAFDAKNPISNPMSFWLEQDVLLYIKKYNIDYCRKVYGDIVDDSGNEVDLTDFEDDGIFETNRPLLKTTGCDRTGCMFCGFGCHLEKGDDSRFVRMKKTHPNQYDYIMKDKERGGLGYKKIIDWMNANLNIHIDY